MSPPAPPAAFDGEGCHRESSPRTNAPREGDPRARGGLETHVESIDQVAFRRSGDGHGLKPRQSARAVEHLFCGRRVRTSAEYETARSGRGSRRRTSGSNQGAKAAGLNSDPALPGGMARQIVRTLDRLPGPQAADPGRSWPRRPRSTRVAALDAETEPARVAALPPAPRELGVAIRARSRNALRSLGWGSSHPRARDEAVRFSDVATPRVRTERSGMCC